MPVCNRPDRRNQDDEMEDAFLEMGWYLERVGRFEGAPQHITLHLSMIILGRDQRLPSQLISRQHVSLQVVNAKWFATDLKSLNGTYVDGKKIPHSVRYELNEGSVVGLGVPRGVADNHFTFCLTRRVTNLCQSISEPCHVIHPDKRRKLAHASRSVDSRPAKHCVLGPSSNTFVQSPPHTYRGPTTKPTLTQRKRGLGSPSCHSFASGDPSNQVSGKECHIPDNEQKSYGHNSKQNHCKQEIAQAVGPNMSEFFPLSSQHPKSEETSQRTADAYSNSQVKMDRVSVPKCDSDENVGPVKLPSTASAVTSEVSEHSVRCMPQFKNCLWPGTRTDGSVQRNVGKPLRKVFPEVRNVSVHLTRCDASSALPSDVKDTPIEAKDTSDSCSDQSSDSPVIRRNIKHTKKRFRPVVSTDEDSDSPPSKLAKVSLLERLPNCNEEYRQTSVQACVGSSESTGPNVLGNVTISADGSTSKTTPKVEIKLEEIEVNQEAAEDDEQLQYSQCDEILIISSDDDCDDRPLLMPTAKTVKKEPEDVCIELSDLEEDATWGVAYRSPCSKNECPTIKVEPCLSSSPQYGAILEDDSSGDFVVHSQVSDTTSSPNLQPVGQDPTEEELAKRLVWKDDSQSCQPPNVDEDGIQFFPDLSQAFDTQEPEEDSDYDSLKQDPFHTSTGRAENMENKIRPPAQRTLLTEPRPMSWRPKKRRGREEWFGEYPRPYRQDNKMPSSPAESNGEHLAVSPTSFYFPNSEIAFDHAPLPNKKSRKKSRRRTRGNDLRKKLQSQMGNRIPIPGGGSDMVMKTKSPEKKKKEVARSKSGSRNQASRVKSAAESSSEPLQTVEVPKEKFTAPKGQRFVSRSAILTEEMHASAATEKKQRVSKKTKVKVTSSAGEIPGKSEPHVFKIPKKVSSGTDSRSPVLGVEPTAPSHTLSQPRDDNMESNMTGAVANQMASIQLATTSRAVVDTPLAVSNNGTDTSANRPQQQSNKKRTVRFADQEGKNLAEHLPIACRSIRTMQNLGHGSFDNVRLATPAKVQESATTLTVDVAIEKIVGWNVRWLEEHVRIPDVAPDIALLPLRPLKLSYRDKDDYLRTYWPCLEHEVWAGVFRDWRSAATRRQFVGLRVAVAFTEVSGSTMTFHCKGAIHSSTRDSCLVEGHLLIMHLRLKSADNSILPAFGYVKKVTKITREQAIQTLLLLSHPAVQDPDCVYLDFAVQMMARQKSLQFDKLMNIYIVSYIKPALRTLEGLSNLANMKYLLKDIIRPRLGNCLLQVPTNAAFSALGSFNPEQRNVILAVATAASKPYGIPQISLIQGPPGTGKTHTVVGILQQILSSPLGNEKILMVAPSNAAVDEVCIRLIRLRAELKRVGSKQKLNFVRIGQVDQVRSEVKKYLLEELVQSNLGRRQREQIEAFDRDLEELQAKKEALQCRKFGMLARRHSHDELGQMSRDIARCQQQIRVMEQNRPPPNIQDSSRHNMRMEILKNANVVVSTLNSCRQSIVETVFGRSATGSVRFTCCIVDEASQCTEPELLLPLQYGMTKLVLVGDPRQLPATVLSKFSAQHGYHMSLFERFEKYFKQDGTGPIWTLTTQYRMHSEICKFPSQLFYEGHLQTPHDVDQRSRSFPVRPYIVLDVTDGQEASTDPSIHNKIEGQFITDLCKLLVMQVAPGTSVGVITFYQAQRQLLRSRFAELSLDIEVNTVDGFQGRQKDVVILSCVRAEGSRGGIGFLVHPQRINVAITRARFALIICCNGLSLERDPRWQALLVNAKTRGCLLQVASSSPVAEVLAKMRKVEST